MCALPKQLIADFSKTLDPFFADLFGEGEGYVAVSYGRTPNKVKFYAWPAEKDKLLAEADGRSETTNVFYCPVLRQTTDVTPITEDGRGGGLSAAVSRPVEPLPCLWADVDLVDDEGNPKDVNHTLLQRLAREGAWRVQSGRHGHEHVYFPLAEPVDLATFERLNKDLKNALGADHAQSHAKWLRLPTFLTHKPVLPAAREVKIVKAPTKLWPANELEVRIRPQGAQTGYAGRRQGTCTTGTQRSAEARVQALLRKHTRDTPSNLSDAFHGVVLAGVEDGVSLDRLEVLLTGHVVAERYEREGRLRQMIEESAKKATPRQDLASHAEWERPLALTRQPGLLPLDALGPVLGPLVEAVANAFQVPADLVINAALPVITTAARGRWTVRVTESWSESFNLCTVSALASGERKSPVVRFLIEALHRLEREAQERVRDEVGHLERRHSLESDRVEMLRKKARNGEYEDQERYLEAAAKLAEYKPTPLPRWLVDDVTPERLTRLLAEQGGALGVISTEPTLFRILSGRYSGGKPNLETVLKATSGDPIRVDRQGQGQTESVMIDHTALSLGLCIQPGLLADFGGGPFRESGLLARFLYVLPPPKVGTRDTIDRSVPDEVRRRWVDALQSIVETVDKIDNSAAAAEGGSNSVNIVDRIRWLRVDTRARSLLKDFRAELEPKLHPQHGELAGLADWGSKLPGAVVRIAAALTLLGNAHAETVGADTMADAIRLGRAYVGHATAAFGSMNGRDDELRRADEVLGWLRTHCKAEFSIRDVHSALQGRVWVNRADDIRAAVETLVEYGHARKVEKQTSSRGRPSQKYELHPIYRQ